MKLNEYPQAIQAAALALNELEDVLSDRREEMQEIEVSIDMTIAVDTNLKNDNQRKAQRAATLQSQQRYQTLCCHELELKRKIADAKANLEFLRNDFSVAKLEMRLAIADKLAGLESRDLIGV